MRGRIRILLSLWLALGPRVARADASGEAEARKRFGTGRLLFEAGRYDEALREFEAAKAIVPKPAFDYNIGRCLERLDRPGQAADVFEQYVKEAPEDPDAVAVERHVAELRALAERRERARHILEQREPPPPVAAPAPTAPPANGLKRAAIALGVVGAAALASGAVLGGLVLSERDRYRSSCAQGTCDDALYERARAQAIATDVLLPVGAVAGVTAIVLGAVYARRHAQRVAAAPGGLQVAF